MGQKVHPYGFRLGYNKTWRSRWFADRDYAKLLHEDLALRDDLKRRFSHAGVSKVEPRPPQWPWNGVLAVPYRSSGALASSQACSSARKVSASGAEGRGGAVNGTSGHRRRSPAAPHPAFLHMGGQRQHSPGRGVALPPKPFSWPW